MYKCIQRSGILITTYGTVQTSWEELGADSQNRQFTWDYIILDEGHKIKNHTNKTSKVSYVLLTVMHYMW